MDGVPHDRRGCRMTDSAASILWLRSVAACDRRNLRFTPSQHSHGTDSHGTASIPAATTRGGRDLRRIPSARGLAGADLRVPTRPPGEEAFPPACGKRTWGCSFASASPSGGGNMRGIWRWLAILAAVALLVTACGR